ncbi:hypothetical protein JOB18_001819 [Solea senegalensis]|uniref:Uncharacterized protein n=1 Tax=Solea senegalensis TaxID=28829 RepID=A0AAV6RLP0_SOLSE|nr:hypothetical protein JOB18_001819 [Solea senegalensis]
MRLNRHRLHRQLRVPVALALLRVNKSLTLDKADQSGFNGEHEGSSGRDVTLLIIAASICTFTSGCRRRSLKPTNNWSHILTSSHPNRSDTAADVNAAQLVPKLCATRKKARQPVGNCAAYYNSNRRCDILDVLCQ